MSNSSELSAICYLTALKEMLKRRGINYGQLADALGCSLPTIKRSLNKPALPLDRLLEIAEVANIEFAEICKRADQLRPKHYVFTDEQDRLFDDRPELLDYFQELISGKSPSEIAKHHGLDVKSSGLYQKHLEVAGLIKRKARNQVKLLVCAPVGFGPGSRYLKREMESFLTSVVTSVVHSETPKRDSFAILKPLTLTEQDYREMVEGIKRLVDTYSALSESRGSVEATLDWRVAIASGRGPQSKLISLPQIRE